MDEESKQTENEVPGDIAQRLEAWHKYQLRSIVAHSTVGIVGISAASIAAVLGGLIGQWLAAIAAACMAVLAFAGLKQDHLRFVRAWRILDAACREYRYGLVTVEDLVKTVSKGEMIIQQMESDERTSRP